MKNKFKNPIILCDYSDPDVIFHDGLYYLVASSFNFVPGLPVLASKNLVEWTLINYAAEQIPFDRYEKVQNAKGIWAPSIRVHDGTFYIFFAMPDEGIFEVHAKNPTEKWSDWNCVWEGKGFIDPCPLWDSDGKLYLVHGYAKSRIGFNSKLGLLELDPSSLKSKSEDKFIFDGTKTQPTIEGPKFYKRNGYYYIFAPAGGVSRGWQTVLRSRQIEGPYEERIVLSQGKSGTNGPHQGGWVQSPDGKDWFVHFQDRGIFGRITHLQPMIWNEDWPVMGTACKKSIETGEPVEKWTAPEFQSDKIIVPRAGISDFQYSSNGGISVQKGSKIKDSSYADGTLWLNPEVLTKKIDSRKILFEKEINLKNFVAEADSERHGILFLGNEYAALQVRKSGEKFFLEYLESSGSENGDEVRTENILFSKEIQWEAKIVFLKLKFISDHGKNSRAGNVRFYAKADFADGTKTFTSKKFKTENAHWVGGRFGSF